MSVYLRLMGSRLAETGWRLSGKGGAQANPLFILPLYVTLRLTWRIRNVFDWSCSSYDTM